MSLADKGQTDLLGPLRRYLRSNVGRPWDKVYSEIRAVADARGVRGFHLLTHVAWFVQTNCVLGEDKQVLTLQPWRHSPVQGFYVHPKSGLLRFAKYRT